MKGLFTLVKTGFIEKEKLKWYPALKLSFVIIILILFFNIFAFFFQNLLISKGYMDEPIKLLPRRRVDLNPWRTFFSGVILTPIIEELTFRLNLKYSKLNFSIMVGGFIVFFVLNRFLDYSRLFNLLIGLLCVIVTFLMLKKFDDRIFIDFWKKQKKAIFYSSILLFASLHLANYQMTPNLFLFLPIVLLTYLIGGFFFSYGRFKYGVFFAIGLHMLNNLIPFIASSIFS